MAKKVSADSPKKKPVESAEKNGDTSTPIATQRPKDNRASLLPRYDDELSGKIERFLAACLMDATLALQRERELGGHFQNRPPFAGRIQYWKHVCAAIRMLGSRVRLGQKHLIEIPDSVITELAKSWQKRSEV